ncbi:MAG TPA: helix-turn-helix transcriptional regulator [Thermomicrobiales bacterium]|nr:helix-turn-helix transcriptional regulator [Thermomicrobiales bacterium]
MTTPEPTSPAMASQGEMISARLAEIGMSVSHFARALGVRSSFIHAVRTGKRRLTKPATVERAAAVLGISADRLYVAGGHLPPDAWTIIKRRPQLVRALRVLDAKLDAREGQFVSRPRMNTR